MSGRGKARKAALGLLLPLFLLSCTFAQPTSGALPIIVKGDSFSLTWKDDSWLIPGDTNKVVKYRVYYRIHGGTWWTALKDTEAHAETTTAKVTHGELEFGIYDIGVSAMDASGEESQIHSSLDATADPECGWYINWIGSK